MTPWEYAQQQHLPKSRGKPVPTRCIDHRPYPVKAGRRRMFLLCSSQRCRLSASAGACGGLCDGRDVGVSRTLRVRRRAALRRWPDCAGRKAMSAPGLRRAAELPAQDPAADLRLIGPTHRELPNYPRAQSTWGGRVPRLGGRDGDPVGRCA